MSIESVMPSNNLGLCHPLFLMLSIFPASVRVFSNENSGLISFRSEWFDFLAVQGTLKSLLQHSPSRKQTEEKYPHFSLRVPSLSPIGLTQPEAKKQGCVGDATIGLNPASQGLGQGGAENGLEE